MWQGGAPRSAAAVGGQVRNDRVHLMTEPLLAFLEQAAEVQPSFEGAHVVDDTQVTVAVRVELLHGLLMRGGRRQPAAVTKNTTHIMQHLDYKISAQIRRR